MENAIIEIKMPVAAWNYIVNVLADQKFRDSSAIIAEITRQSQPQLAQLENEQREAAKEAFPETEE